MCYKVIKVENLSVATKHQHILKNISYTFEDGKIYGLLGPNGAGKTTLFKSMINVIEYSGQIENSHSRNNIGHLIEYPAFYDNLSCYDNLKLHASYKKIHLDNILNFLSMVGLKEAKEKKFKTLSMGMKQRLGIARSLMGNPKTILLDEPSNGLDPSGIREIRHIISNHVNINNRTTIISSHILKEIEEFTDVFVFINNGKIIANIKNTHTSYACLKLKELPIDISQNKDFQGEISIIFDGEFYNLIGEHQFLSTLQENIEELNLEELYLKIMEIQVEEVFLK
ncbi:ABC transporter ATP-binding protein [Mammaliicoccus sciuri]|nr:ABC transporter ATP-binding protein [Mammaliicoccus sciuri]